MWDVQIYVGFIQLHVAHFHSDHVQGGKLLLCSDCRSTRVALLYCETGGGSKKRKIQSDLARISGEQRAVGHCIPTCWTYWWKTRHDSPKPPNQKGSCLDHFTCSNLVLVFFLAGRFLALRMVGKNQVQFPARAVRSNTAVTCHRRLLFIFANIGFIRSEQDGTDGFSIEEW